MIEKNPFYAMYKQYKPVKTSPCAIIPGMAPKTPNIRLIVLSTNLPWKRGYLGYLIVIGANSVSKSDYNSQ